MQVDTGSFKALQAEVAELRARVEQVADEACVLRTLEETWFKFHGYGSGPAAQQRPRHLRPVDGGQP